MKTTLPITADAVDPTLARGRRVWRLLWWTLLLTAALVAGGFAFQRGLALAGIYVGYNETDSLLGAWYVIVKGDIPTRRGELLGYRGGPNKRYPVGILWVKTVGGIGGDRVEVEDRRFHVNGLSLYAKPKTRFGEPLDQGPTGTIPPGHYFVYTPHPDSYDSRYAEIGWISPTQVVGRAYQVF